MFNIQVYSNPDHLKRRPPTLSLDELCVQRPEEREMPYFALPVSQLEQHEGYSSLSPLEKATFLLLLLLLWRSNALLPDFAPVITKALGLNELGWQNKRRLLIEKGLLEESPDGVYLLNRELRQQYIDTLNKSIARGKNKTQVTSS